MSEWAGNGYKWRLTEHNAPPENVQLDTMSEGGIQQPLIYLNQLWWFPDMKMYVYYTPKFWRQIAQEV